MSVHDPVFQRSSGILLHPTSLPGPHGLGDFGPASERFLRALKAMGQRCWQVLPLGPTGYGDSPYASLSSFAGNPMLISLERLAEEGLLPDEALREFPVLPDAHADFGALIPARHRMLDLACREFDRRAAPVQVAAFDLFRCRHAAWLEDYALYVALKDVHGGRPWMDWEPGLVRRHRRALDKARHEFAPAIRSAALVQFFFARQWSALRKQAHGLGITLIGDLPLYVAHDSADTWSRQDLFQLEHDGRPRVVAGVPPDYFSATGQLWGNPIYDWPVHLGEDFAWWRDRMRHTLAMVDIVRIDHFRGLEAYWEIPGGAKTAIDGRWVKGPDAAFFHALRRSFGHLPIIAEDLGLITDEVIRLREDFDLPGMHVLQFCLGDPDEPTLNPDLFGENGVVYTGTHDNNTTRGWFNEVPGEGSTRSAEQILLERAQACKRFGTDGGQIEWDMISEGLRTRCHTFIAPLQDALGLGAEARMNTPGTTQGNWQWRFTWDQLTPEIMERLLLTTRHFGRTP